MSMLDRHISAEKEVLMVLSSITTVLKSVLITSYLVVLLT